MKQAQFQTRVRQLFEQHEKLILRKNSKLKDGNGIFDRYQNPVVTAEHTPIFWRYDLDPKTNPHLMERMGINATFSMPEQSSMRGRYWCWREWKALIGSRSLR